MPKKKADASPLTPFTQQMTEGEKKLTDRPSIAGISQQLAQWTERKERLGEFHFEGIVRYPLEAAECRALRSLADEYTSVGWTVHLICEEGAKNWSIKVT
jgi:hypothetical protein